MRHMFFFLSGCRVDRLLTEKGYKLHEIRFWRKEFVALLNKKMRERESEIVYEN